MYKLLHRRSAVVWLTCLCIDRQCVDRVAVRFIEELNTRVAHVVQRLRRKPAFIYIHLLTYLFISPSALTLLLGRQEEHQACKQ